MNARTIVGKLSLTCSQWQKLLILLFVGLRSRASPLPSAGLYVLSLFYVMKSGESRAEKRLGACRRRFVWRKPFLGRFESHWKPFLTSKSLYLLMDRPFRSDLEKVLWLHRLPFGLRNSVLSAFTTLQLLPEQELPEFFERLRCQSCIVVGNGYSIHGQHLGKKIDSHDVIIRLNDAPVKKHKEDVGERTSIRLFFPESAFPNPLENNDKETLMVFVPFKPLDFTWLREVLLKTRNKTKEGFWHQPPGEWNGNVSRLRILNPYVIYEATYKLLKLEVWSMRYATMGITALNLALHMCQEVNIAGFGYPDNHDNATPIHYYNTGHSLRKELFEHNVTAERKWLLKMIKQEVIAEIGKPALQAQNH